MACAHGCASAPPGRASVAARVRTARPRAAPLRCSPTAHAPRAAAASPAPAPLPPRRAALAAAAAAAALALLRPPRADADAAPAAPAPGLAVATFSGGDFLFLEASYDNLRYAGVRDVTAGYIGADRQRAVRVAYDPSKISYEKLLAEYWKSVRPTQADGQFEGRGPAFAAAIWVATPAQRAAAELSRDRLARSGVFGAGVPIVTPVREGPPEGSFEAAPEAERGAGRRDPKRLEAQRKKTGRAAYLDGLWGLSTFCSGRVCGYVEFAKGCTEECLDVFPEYRDQPNAFQS
jgi:peptide-methionine (S)-S-oxide reductase